MGAHGPETFFNSGCIKFEELMSDTEFEAFMSSYQDMVYTTAMRLLGSQAEAEDVSQETFLKAYKNFAELKASPTAGGWLKTVARNLALNHLARHRRRWLSFDAASGAEALQSRLPIEAPADEALGAGAESRRLQDALLALPQAQRLPIVLFHFEDMPYEEIAQKLGVSLGKVKTDIFRGRAALRCALEESHGAN